MSQALLIEPVRDGIGERHLRRQVLTSFVWDDSVSSEKHSEFVEGMRKLFEPHREPDQIREAASWAHARRKFFEFVDLRQAPIAIEAVTWIDAILAIERAANCLAPDERCAYRRDRAAILVTDVEA